MHRFLIDTWWAGIHLRVGAFPVLIFAGVVAGLWIVLRRARGAGLSPRDLAPIAAGSLVVGFLGARLGHVAQYGTAGGIVLYGGLIAGMAAAMVLARGKGLPALRVADLAAPGVLLAAAFGRVGCFLAGCCFGDVADGGLRFPRGSPAFRHQLREGLLDSHAAASLPTVPIALFEAVALLAFFVVLSRIRSRRPGTVLGTALLLYPAWRFVAEFWRPDHAPYWPGGLTFSQGISLACVAVGAALLLRRPGPSAPPVYPIRPASALQLTGALAAVCVSLSTVSCAVHARSGEMHQMQGVSNYRKPGNTGVRKPDSKPPEADDDGGWFEDCMDNCISECIDECVEECMEECSESLCDSVCGPEADVEDAPELGTPVTTIVGTLQPGNKYKGSIGIEAVVNRRLQVLLKLDGTLTAGKAAPQGARSVKLKLRKIDLRIGDARWQGSGEVDLLVGPDSEVHVVKHTLPADLMSALAALNDLSGTLLRGVTSEEPLSDLAKVVKEELSGPEVKAELSLVTTFEGQERWVLGDARVLEDPPGTFKLIWKLNY